MVKSFLNRGLRDLFETGKSPQIPPALVKRIKLRLAVLNQATGPEDLNLPGFSFHRLRGFNPPRYTIHVNGPFALTFEFLDGDVYRLDLEQYH